MQSSAVPFYLPIRSKYLQIELLKYCFSKRWEVARFLRSLSRTSSKFYNRFQDEIISLFEVHNITLQPPLKFVNTTGEKPSETNLKLQNKLMNFNRVRKLEAYEDHF